MRRILRGGIVTAVVLTSSLLTLDVSIHATPTQKGIQATNAQSKGSVGDSSGDTRKIRVIRKVPAQPGPPNVVITQPFIISEFRLNGTNGANDEFIEIYNNSDADWIVDTADGSPGFALAASDGVVRFIIPDGTVFRARAHYLGCNSVGYSVSTYPAGNGTTATCDATYTVNIPNGEDPDGVGGNPPLPRLGIALFNTSNPANFHIIRRLDAVGPTEEPNTLYKEGTGVRNLNHFATGHSYVRRMPGGCIGTSPGSVDSNCTSPAAIGGTAPSSSFPQDTGNNRDDFIFIDTNGTSQSPEAIIQRLGAPGPENLSSPIVRQNTIKSSLIDQCVSSASPPNRQRDTSCTPPDTCGINETFGRLDIRRKFTNQTGTAVTRLRFRVVDISTFPAGIFFVPPPPNNFCQAPGSSCAADLRVLTSPSVTVSVSAACGGGTADVQGTTLEQATPSFENQPNGGGFNSSLSAGTVTLATPLAAGASINVNFRFGVQQTGAFRVFLIVEALP